MRKHITSIVIFVAGFALSAIIDGRRLSSLAQGSISNPAVAEVAAQTTQKPSTSQKWEYRVVNKFIVRSQADIDFELNRLGDQGYEVCWVAQSGSELGGASLTILLRRPR